MNNTVTQFYAKNPDEKYGDSYDGQHGYRLDAMVAHFKLNELKSQKLLDVGGGLGFLGKRLDPSNDYWVIDGAKVELSQRVSSGRFIRQDLDHDYFGSIPIQVEVDDSVVLHDLGQTFDGAFCLETLEHLSNPYHCLTEIKKLVKIGAPILLSVPTIDVWHNVVMPALLWPQDNFRQFLGQMALPIVGEWDYIPKPNEGWPAHHYLCINRPWQEKRLMFPKAEQKFIDATPLECTNL
jgi:2-polyprenyl-3-methyl-5-hydroxy-6-metoxy-1,4-benzoquinol methylase